MDTITQREKEILAYIRKMQREKGYAPSVRDIKAELSIKSTSTVYTYLQRMEEKGLLSKENGKSRTLRLLDEQPNVPSVPVPILGRVTAGQPILAQENPDGYVYYPSRGLHSVPDSLFALRVTGTSMIQAGILDGDVVIVEQQESAENGDIVVALIEDEATVKTFYKENGHYRLQPENPTMEPIIVNSVRILGRVISSVRYY